VFVNSEAQLLSESVRGRELPWHTISADKSFPSSWSQLQLLLLSHPQPIKVVCTVDPARLFHLLQSSLEDSASVASRVAMHAIRSVVMLLERLGWFDPVMHHGTGTPDIGDAIALHAAVLRWSLLLCDIDCGGGRTSGVGCTRLRSDDIERLLRRGMPLTVRRERLGGVLPLLAELELLDRPGFYFAQAGVRDALFTVDRDTVSCLFPRYRAGVRGGAVIGPRLGSAIIDFLLTPDEVAVDAALERGCALFEPEQEFVAYLRRLRLGQGDLSVSAGVTAVLCRVTHGGLVAVLRTLPANSQPCAEAYVNCLRSCAAGKGCAIDELVAAVLGVMCDVVGKTTWPEAAVDVLHECAASGIQLPSEAGAALSSNAVRWWRYCVACMAACRARVRSVAFAEQILGDLAGTGNLPPPTHACHVHCFYERERHATAGLASASPSARKDRVSRWVTAQVCLCGCDDLILYRVALY
jgi:hypothetical protein